MISHDKEITNKRKYKKMREKQIGLETQKYERKYQRKQDNRKTDNSKEIYGRKKILEITKKHDGQEIKGIRKETKHKGKK